MFMKPEKVLIGRHPYIKTTNRIENRQNKLDFSEALQASYKDMMLFLPKQIYYIINREEIDINLFKHSDQTVQLELLTIIEMGNTAPQSLKIYLECYFHSKVAVALTKAMPTPEVVSFLASHMKISTEARESYIQQTINCRTNWRDYEYIQQILPTDIEMLNVCKALSILHPNFASYFTQELNEVVALNDEKRYSKYSPASINYTIK